MASTSFHEAIAYFFEHYVGNDINFQKQTTKRFFNSKINFLDKERSPIRIESADEEYPIHILIRYELEKDLINGKLNVNDLKDVWTEKYKKYLDLEIKNDNDGLLQDPHWFIGQFGYFPSYVIGLAYESQLQNSPCKNIDLTESIKKEDLTHPVDWLKQNVFSHGMSKSPKEILISSTNEKFNPKYYIDELSSEK